MRYGHTKARITSQTKRAELNICRECMQRRPGDQPLMLAANGQRCPRPRKKRSGQPFRVALFHRALILDKMADAQDVEEKAPAAEETPKGSLVVFIDCPKVLLAAAAAAADAEGDGGDGDAANADAEGEAKEAEPAGPATQAVTVRASWANIAGADATAARHAARRGKMPHLWQPGFSRQGQGSFWIKKL